MGALSDYLEGKLIDHLFQGTAYTAPTNYYPRLWTATLSDSSTPATSGEVTATSSAYSPDAQANSNTVWTKSSNQASNTADITYDTATADWGTVTDVMLTDNATQGSGNSIFYGALTASKTVSTGDVFKFAAGDLVVSLD